MKTRWRVTVTALVIGLLGLGGVPAPAQLPGIAPPGIAPPAPRGSTIEIDPTLRRVLGTAAPGQRVEAVLTFNQYPNAIVLQTVRATGVQVLSFRRLPMLGVRGTPAQIRSLFGLPGVRSIYYNRRLEYFLSQSVPLVGADRVWTELGFTGRGVGIAIIDSGIDATHPDLPFGQKVIQNVKVGPDLFGAGPIVVENLADTDTTSGHGTHVASIAAGTGAALAGRYRGVAVGANLVGLGAGEWVFVLTALESFDWVLANRGTYGIRVISNSWGTNGPFSPDDPVNVASRMARDAGLTVVFAAGNDGPGENTLNPYCVAPWVVCAAAGLRDGQTLADFSSRGIPGDSLYRPTITAPGVGIVAARATTGIAMATFFAVDSIDLGTDAVYYMAISGTSMATPHVSGTVALMLEANPALTPDQIKAVLAGSATPMPGYAEYQVGAGYLNAFQAVTTALMLASNQDGLAAPRTARLLKSSGAPGGAR
jgi:serine protease AprX